ncbi:MAG: hypothetical protein L0Y71_24095 [Gemmataceae bacterium]|nr:hypothetical protein [Gemmataceae bacterium]
MEKVSRIAIWVAAVYWVCCLAIHVVVAVTRPGPLPGYSYAYWFLLTWITKLASPNAKEDPAPRWYVPTLGVAGLICCLWPWAVGSGVPNAPSLLGMFGDEGMPGGPPGDRELNSHSRRVRAITEEEFQQVRAWEAVVQTGIMAGFSGMVLAAVIYFWQGGRTPNLFMAEKSRVRTPDEDGISPPKK